MQQGGDFDHLQTDPLTVSENNASNLHTARISVVVR